MRTWGQWFKENSIRLGYGTLRVVNFAVSTVTLGFVDASSWLAWRHRKYNTDLELQELQPPVEKEQVEIGAGQEMAVVQAPFLNQEVEAKKRELQEESRWLDGEIKNVPWGDVGRVDAVLNPFRIFVVLKSGTDEIPKKTDLAWTDRLKEGFVNLRSSMRYLAYFGAIVAIRGANYFSDAATRAPGLTDVYGTTGQGHDAMVRDDPASYNSHSSYARNKAWFGTMDSYETGGLSNAVNGILWGLIVYQAAGDIYAMVRNYMSHKIIRENTILKSSVPAERIRNGHPIGLENPTVDSVFHQRHWWERLYYNVVNDSGEAPNLVVWGILLGTKFAHSFVKDFYEGFKNSFPSYGLTPDPSWASPVTHTCYDHRTGVVLSCATRFMEDFNNKFNSGLRDQFPTVSFSLAFALLALGLYHQLERRRPNPAIVAEELQEIVIGGGAHQRQLPSVLPAPQMSISTGTGASTSSEPSAASLSAVSEVDPMSRQRVRHYSLPSSDQILMSGLIPVQNVRRANPSPSQSNTSTGRSRSSSDQPKTGRLLMTETWSRANVSVASATPLIPPTTPTTGSGVSSSSTNTMS